MTQDKAALRRRMRGYLAHCAPAGEARAQAESRIADKLSALFSLSAPGDIALYSGYGHEPLLTPFFPRWEAAGYGLCLPCSPDADGAPLFRRYVSGDVLAAAGKPRFVQPAPAASRITPAVIVAPMLAFDDNGTRLGQGGGYFDKAVALYEPAVFIAVAFSCAQTVNPLPREPHDITPHYIVTEKSLTAF